MNNDKVSMRLIKLSLGIVVVGFAAFIVSIVLFQTNRNFILTAPIDSLLFSHLGDIIGGFVGTIWGLAGVLLFYVALRSQSEQLKLQMEEISLQRVELQLTRKELQLATAESKRMADAQEKSEKALDQQSKILRKTLDYQAFQSFTTEYSQPIMSQCVKDLWDFARKHTNEIEQAYIHQFQIDYANKEFAKYSTLEESFTLHNKRRLVTSFYYRVQSFIDQDIFPMEIFYIYWSRTDLEIIPKVLIPMEKAIGKMIKGEYFHLDMSDSPIMRLYNNSPITSK